MGTIRDSFKKFLGFDVEEQSEQKNKKSDDEVIAQGKETKQFDTEATVKESTQTTIAYDQIDRGVNPNLTTAPNNLEAKTANTNGKNDAVEQNIFAKSTIKYEKPKTYGDACEIVEFLLEGYTVYVDVVDLELSKARRIVDFIDGAIFASGGDREIIKHKYFKFSPTYEYQKQKD